MPPDVTGLIFLQPMVTHTPMLHHWNLLWFSNTTRYNEMMNSGGFVEYAARGDIPMELGKAFRVGFED